MDTRPIAVFDSGLGGLTAVSSLYSIFPNENMVYFGDTARVPYGTRSEDTIIHFTRQAFRFLSQHNPKAIVVACGTASTVALAHMEDMGVPVVGVMKPCVEKAALITKSNKVGLIATPASVRSGAYTKYIAQINPNVQMTAYHGRLLVPIIEDGRVNDAVARLLIEEYMQPFILAGIDTLILGCTHYPFLEPKIRQFLPPHIQIISQGHYVAESLKDYLQRHPEIDAFCSKNSICEYFTTESPQKFSETASIFLHERIQAKHCPCSC